MARKTNFEKKLKSAVEDDPKLGRRPSRCGMTSPPPTATGRRSKNVTRCSRTPARWAATCSAWHARSCARTQPIGRMPPRAGRWHRDRHAGPLPGRPESAGRKGSAAQSHPGRNDAAAGRRRVCARHQAEGCRRAAPAGGRPRRGAKERRPVDPPGAAARRTGAQARKEARRDHRIAGHVGHASVSHTIATRFSARPIIRMPRARRARPSAW